MTTKLAKHEDEPDSSERNLVVVIDGSPRSDLAIQKALILSRRPGLKITLIYLLSRAWVAGAATAHVSVGVDLHATLEEDAIEYLASACREFLTTFLVSSVVRARNTRQWLSENAGGYDAVIAGTRNSRGPRSPGRLVQCLMRT